MLYGKNRNEKFATIQLIYRYMGRGKVMCMTTDIVKLAKEEISKLEAIIKKIDVYLADAPDGYLKWQKKDGRTYYYRQYMFEDANSQSIWNEENRKFTGNWKREYIKKDSSLAKDIAQKNYYEAIRPILEKNLCELKRFIRKYQKEKADSIYDMLSDERKKLVTPLQVSVNERLKRWHEENYEKNNMYPENLRYETEQGELVRSKSEVIIGNILYRHRRDILYKYERPLMLVIDGKMKTVYPDFTIINVHTGKIVYWEHAGRMDDSHYASDFVKKMNGYATNGLIPGKDVILTFETQGNPLDIGSVKQLVEEMIEG